MTVGFDAIRRTCELNTSPYKLYSTDNKTVQRLGQHACTLLCVNYSFQSHAWKSLQIKCVFACVNIGVTETLYRSSAEEHWHRWAFNQIKHSWEKKKHIKTWNIYVHSANIQPFIRHPQKYILQNPTTAETPLGKYGANVHSDRTGQWKIFKYSK